MNYGRKSVFIYGLPGAGGSSPTRSRLREKNRPDRNSCPALFTVIPDGYAAAASSACPPAIERIHSCVLRTFSAPFGISMTTFSRW